MLQPIDRVSAATQRPSPSPDAGDAGVQAYRADWRPAPAVTVAAVPPVTAAPSSPSGADAVRLDAALAKDVYNDTPAPPVGTRVATPDELKRLNLTPEMLEQPGQSSFRARVYVSGAPGQEHYTVAFRGTQSGDDWKSNLEQGIGRDSVHYRQALEIGRALSRSDADVSITGHSLGGGLAAEAALASGRHADTFNAAGLNVATIGKAQAIAAGSGRGSGAVDNYRVPGEILTFVQERGDRVIGGLLGGLIGAATVDAPAAYGAQHDLPLVAPSGKSWFAEHSRIDRHGMDWVLAGAAALR